MFLFLLPLILLVLYLTWPFLALLVRQHVSPLRRLRGPKNPSFFMGNLMEMHDQENNDLIARWEKEYGSVFTYRGFVGGCRLMITDPVAVAYILANAVERTPGEGGYEKPEFVRDGIATMATGYDGLLTVEGDQHRRQRKIVTPAFAPGPLKSLTPVFWQKAIQLRDVFVALSGPVSDSPPQSPTLSGGSLSSPPTPPATIEEHDLRYPPSQPFQMPFSFGLRNRRLKNVHTLPSSPTQPSRPSSPPPVSRTSRGIRIDVLSYLSRATLDIIGLTGFGYKFNSLPAPDDLDPTGKRRDGQEDELSRAFSIAFSAARKFRVITILQVWFPFLRRFRRNIKTAKEAHKLIYKIGNELIEERTQAMSAEKDGAAFAEKDLLSILIRSNRAEVASQQMSMHEILCQISTFLVAGYETTSNSLSWTLYALCQNPDTQRKLRHELQAIQAELKASVPAEMAHDFDRLVMQDPTYRSSLEAALNRAPYLDSVIRESLRIHAPVTSTMRVCMREGGDEIPVSGAWGDMGEKSRVQDGGGYLDKDGVRRHTIKINKWDIITVPIQAVNKSVALWGEDAAAFRPERWENPPTAVKQISGVYSNILSFLGGSRNCIGYKFALNEMKIFLYVLLKDLEFSMDPAMLIEKKVNVVTRPFVKSEPQLGTQMPVYVRPVNNPDPHSEV